MGRKKRNVNPETARLIGKNIKFLREQKGWSQADLAKELKIGSGSIGHWENAVKPPNDVWLVELSSKFDVPVFVIKNEDIGKINMDEMKIKIEKWAVDLFFNSFVKLPPSPDVSSENFIEADELYNTIMMSDTPDYSLLVECRYKYYQSFKQDGVLAGACNTLMMIFIHFMMLRLPEEYYHKYSNQEITQQDIINYVLDDEYKISDAKKDLLNDVDEIIDECVLALKKNSDTADIADFYIAMRYFSMMINYDDEDEAGALANSGFLMLACFAQVENEYCYRFLDVFFGGYEKVEFLLK